MIIDGTNSWKRWAADLYVYRGALQSLMLRNLKSRYKQAVLGALWALLQPVVQVGVFTLIFGVLAKVPSGSRPFPLFALAGILPWNLFSRVVSEGAVSLVANQNLMSKLFFPRIYLVVAVAAAPLVDCGITLALLLILMAAYGVNPGVHSLVAIPALLSVLLLSIGLTAFLASVNARWRDVQHTVPFLLQMGLLATPVIYRTDFVPDRWRWLLALNPLTAMIEIFRGAMLGLAYPEPRVLAVSLAISFVIMIGGLLVFRRLEATLVDLI